MPTVQSAGKAHQLLCTIQCLTLRCKSSLEDLQTGVLKMRQEREETREMLIPSHRARFIARMLRMREDYDIQSVNISTDNGKLTIQIAFGDGKGQST